MTELPKNYTEFFRLAFAPNPEDDSYKPFAYQHHLSDLDTSLPSLINVPTGAGKTAAILGAWLWHRLHNSESVGRRLIYCLPMRTLVEQTLKVAVEAVNRLRATSPETFEKDPKRFEPYVLMGGDVTDEWDSHPERECILIGTQDMLLSRALNRGYAMSRFRWPVHFGLLNNDSLWIFDEIQLMGDGLATAAQLAAFREKFGVFGNCQSIWMSATLDRNWLKQIDFTEQVEQLRLLELSDADRASENLAKRLNAIKSLRKAPFSCRLPKGLAGFIKDSHQVGTQTLIVVNTVNRAREVYDELKKTYGSSESKRKKNANSDLLEQPIESVPQIELIHSRFRPTERARWQKLFNEKIDESSAGRIIVATQVVEAGVDISSRLLVTDIAPFSSLVQRFGRCNRGGEFGYAEIYWVDRPLTEKREKLADIEVLEEKELIEISRPYAWPELKRAAEMLVQLQSASPSALLEVKYTQLYTPTHVLRRRDIVDLFDTTADLSGYDLDVSRFVRGSEERDLSVAWREINGNAPDESEPRLTRDELCSVPLHEIRAFVKDKIAWTWDALAGEWRRASSDELHPGMILLLDVKDGGYHEERGWDGKSKPVLAKRPEMGEPNEAYSDDPLTFQPKKYLRYTQTLAAHSRETQQAAEQIIESLNISALDEFRVELVKAAHYHDWGKAHKIFQSTLHCLDRDADLQNISFEPLLAKSMSNRKHSRPKFRHELASALALLQTQASDLTVYLSACHHGKVRLSIRAMPDERKPEKGKRYARGIWDGEELPDTDLGNGAVQSNIILNLEPMLLGRSEKGETSWLERMLALRDCMGIFRLAYLECLIRAADVRASENPQDDVEWETTEDGQ